MATGMSVTKGGRNYRVVQGSGVDLTKHVGHTVALTGTVSAMSASTSGAMGSASSQPSAKQRVRLRPGDEHVQFDEIRCDQSGRTGERAAVDSDEHEAHFPKLSAVAGESTGGARFSWASPKLLARVAPSSL